MLLFAATEEAGFIGLVSRSRSTRRFLERLVGVIKCLQYSGHVLLWSDKKKTCLLWCHRCWCQKNNIPKQCLLWFSMLKLSFGFPVTFSPQIDICLASKCWHQCRLPWFFEAKSRAIQCQQQAFWMWLHHLKCSIQQQGLYYKGPLVWWWCSGPSIVLVSLSL